MVSDIESLNKVLEEMVSPIKEFGFNAWDEDSTYKYKISQALSLAENIEHLGLVSYLSRIIVYNLGEENLDFWRNEGRKALEPLLSRFYSFSLNQHKINKLMPMDSKLIVPIMKQGWDFFRDAKSLKDNREKALGFAAARRSFQRAGYDLGVQACDYEIRPLIEWQELKEVLALGEEVERELRSEYSDYL